jgi:peptide/nickel transport system substrate-binding protein
MSNERPQNPLEKPISRRQLLRGALAGGVLLTGGGMLSACGGKDSGGTGTGSIRNGGTLRVGATGGGPSDSIDAHVLVSDPDIARAFQLYEPLAIRNTDYKLEMVVAESIEPEARPDVWTVRLKPDITFHNGKRVTADDVLFSLERIVDPDNPKTGAASISYIDIKQSKKLDERTVRVQLQIPNVNFPDDVGQYFNGIVPKDYDPKQPVGTGPFKFESFEPGQQSAFSKFQDYWRKGQPHVDELKIIDFPDDTARVNALLGSQVDAITNLPPSQIASIKQTGQLRPLIANSGNWQPFTMRVDQAPFNDERVGQAMRLIVDRQQMIEQALVGYGRVANDLYSPYDICYAGDEFEQREQDLEQARSLLRQAGQSDLRVQLITSPVYQGIVEAAQVFAEQAKGAGVAVNVRKVDTGTFYGNSYLNWTFAQDFWFTRTYLGQVSQGSMPDSPFNETHWEDPEFLKLIQEARAELNDDKRCELLQEAQRIEYERGGYIVWSFSDQIDAHSAEVAGFEPSKTGIPLGNYGFRTVGNVA